MTNRWTRRTALVAAVERAITTTGALGVRTAIDHFGAGFDL